MFNFISSFLSTIGNIIGDITNAMNRFYNELVSLTDNVKNIANGDSSSLRTYLGWFRYVVGDGIYYMYCLIALIGCLYTVYVLVKGILNVLNLAKLSAFKKIPINL